MNIAQSNPFARPATSSQAAAIFAAETERAAFIRRTYLHLCAAILAFIGLECVIFSVVPDAMLQRFLVGRWTWLALLAGFMVVSWVARSWAESGASPVKQYCGLGLYVGLQALLFVPLLYIAQQFAGDGLIKSAGVITLVIFGGLSVVVFVTRSDFSFLRMYLFWGGILAVGTVLCAVIFSFAPGIWFSVAMIALASGYILYDTSNVLHHYRTDQHVAASLALFASVAILFWYVLRLLMALSNRD